jgi:elongation factor 2
LVGVDKYIVKTATITDDGEDACWPLKDMKYSVSPVVRVAVQTKNPSDLPKLVEGLKRLAKVDPLVEISVEESGEHVVAGAGELHLEICLKDLQDDFMAGAPLKISDPVVSFRETIIEKTHFPPGQDYNNGSVMAKSANKHNRLYFQGQPLTEECCVDIEAGKCGEGVEPPVRAAYLVEKYHWDSDHAKNKIWCFGPDDKGPNVVVDVTKGVFHMNELKDSVIAAWQWATKEGVLAQELMRGIRVDIHDVTMHADTIHRGASQILPTARQAVYAVQLASTPRFMEPMFSVDIQTVEEAMGGIYQVLSRRRAVILGEENRPGTPIYFVRAYLPVAESFGFTADLREHTKGQAFPQCVFDHWQLFPGNPLEPKTDAFNALLKIRARKNLKVETPQLSDFNERL